MRRSLEVLFAILLLSVGGPAFAQNLETTGPSLTTDTFQQIDDNGVDLINGTFNLPGPSLSYGEGEGRVSLDMRWSGRSWQFNTPSIWRDDDNSLFVNTGRGVEEFELTGAGWTPTRGNSSRVTCIFYNQSQTQMRECNYVGHDGTMAQFKAFNPLVDPPSYFAPELGNVNGNFAYVVHPDGRGAYVQGTGIGNSNFYFQGGAACLGNNGNCGVGGNGSWSTTVPVRLYVGTGYQQLTINTPGLTFNNRKTRNIFRPYNTTQTIIDPAGQTWSYTFNSNQDMTAVRRPGSASNNITIAYNSNHKVTSATTAAGTWTYSYSSNNGIGTTTRTAPDNSQYVATYVRKKGNVRTVRDELNRTTSYTYDASNRLSTITYPEQNWVQYGYDARGNLTTVTRHPKPGAVPVLPDIITRAEYPASCPNGGGCNLPTAMIDGNQNRTEVTYDGVRVTSITRPAVNGIQPQARYTYALIPRRIRAADGTVTTQSFSRYLPTQISECRTLASCAGTSDEKLITIDYGQNNPNSEVNWMPMGITTSGGSQSNQQYFTYTSLGDVASQDGPIASSTDTTYFRYDALHRQIGRIDLDSDGPGGANLFRAARNTYSPDGLLILEEAGVVAGPSDTAWAAFTPRNLTATQYDSAGRVLRKVRAAGGVTQTSTETAYDNRNRVWCTTVRMNRAAFPTVSGSTIVGAAPSACTPASGADGDDRITQNVYDLAGQRTQVRQAVGTTAEQAYAIYTYSANGRQTSVTDANGNRAEMTWDGHDRQSRWYFPSETRSPPGQVDYGRFEEYGYDNNGNRISLRRRDGSVFTFQFDVLNRVTLKVVPDRLDIGIPLSATRDVYYSYDLMGNQTSARFDSAAGEGLTFDYSPLGSQLFATSNMGGVSRALTRTFSGHGSVRRLTYPDSLFVDYTEEPNGLLTNMVANIGTTLPQYTYDEMGRVATRQASQYPMSIQGYWYDPIGRLTSIQYEFDGTAMDMYLGFTYNAANQIVTRTRTNDFYAYDGEVAVNRPYTVNGLNQYLMAGTASFTYDGNGNLAGDGTYTYAYDNENRLIGRSGGVTLAYDPIGHLFSVVGPSGTTQFLHDGDNMVAEYDGAGTMLRRYVYPWDATQPVAWFEGAAMTYPRYPYSDQVGSVIAVAQPAVGSVGINSYDNWGIPDTKTSGRFRFAGNMWLSEIGIYYARARMYSPTLGRFLQTDPVGYEDQVNLYSYAANDPVNNIDRNGREIMMLGGTPADRTRFINFVRSVTGITPRIGSNGLLSVPNPPRRMNDAGRVFMDTLNAPERVVVRPVHEVPFNYDSFPTNVGTGNMVDVADLEAAAARNRRFGGAVLSHILVERLDYLRWGSSYTTAHMMASGEETRQMGGMHRDEDPSIYGPTGMPTPHGPYIIRYRDINNIVVRQFNFTFDPFMTPR